MYSMKNIDGKESNTAKGVNIATEFNEFKDTLFNKKIIRHKMRRFLGKKHKMGTYEINKIWLSAFDDKRFVLDDRIHTLAYFHKDLKNRFSEMSINNKDSKSFSKMITNKNKFSIGGLIGVHVSSIVKLGCQDNLKPVYFFLRKKVLLRGWKSLVLFVRSKSFHKKINWLYIVLIASFYYVTYTVWD